MAFTLMALNRFADFRFGVLVHCHLPAAVVPVASPVPKYITRNRRVASGR